MLLILKVFLSLLLSYEGSTVLAFPLTKGLSLFEGNSFNTARMTTATGSSIHKGETKVLQSMPNDSDAASGARIGILGFGTIASAIATGLLSQNEVPIDHVTVTKRSEKKSTTLKNDFAERVTVISEEGPSGHQQVVDAADIVFLCVLPQQVEEVLKGVKLDAKRHTIVSLVVCLTISESCWLLDAIFFKDINFIDQHSLFLQRPPQSTANLQTLRDLSNLPEKNVYKMICKRPLSLRALFSPTVHIYATYSFWFAFCLFLFQVCRVSPNYRERAF
jgi:hypothetical protein